MEIICGRTTRRMDAAAFAEQAAGYGEILVDLGTGDGRFALEAAQRSPGLLAVGVDACRENLRKPSRSAPGNALFVIANAAALPRALYGQAGRISINFPWGSLRDGLLEGDPALLEGLNALGCPGARIEVLLNRSALAEAGWDLLSGGAAVRDNLRLAGYAAAPQRIVEAAALRALPSTWAKRLAYSRTPEAVLVAGRKR